MTTNLIEPYVAKHRSSRLAAAACLFLTLGAGMLLRSLHPAQPIVENYVGRQIPTAMVARNLERGSGFLHPRLDTAPAPNYFLVEPPVYESLVVGLRRVTGLPLDVCGRLLSAAAIMLAAWGVYSLMHARFGESTALAAAVALSMLPITIRYGRAFQPDALMLGACTAGLACWDLAAYRDPGSRRLGLVLLGWLLLAAGIASKATAGYLAVVAFVAVLPRPTWKSLALCVSTVLPAVAWYAWASRLASSAGSLASAENRDIWLGLIGLDALASAETWTYIGRFLILRAFTPLGLLAAAWGLGSKGGERGGARVWWVWSGLALATMGLLAGKLHHEYYWLCLAPPAAAGIALAWRRIDAWRPWAAAAAAAAFAALSLYVSDSTWRTPEEWEGLVEAAREVSEGTPRDDLVAAPEALLYFADRRGCRLEYSFSAATRAASEWGPVEHGLTPVDLVEFYRNKGARWFADVGAVDDEDPRKDLHDEIRRRYKVVIDRPDVLLAELPPGETLGHAD